LTGSEPARLGFRASQRDATKTGRRSTSSAACWLAFARSSAKKALQCTNERRKVHWQDDDHGITILVVEIPFSSDDYVAGHVYVHGDRALVLKQDIAIASCVAPPCGVVIRRWAGSREV